LLWFLLLLSSSSSSIYAWVFQLVLSFRFPHQNPVCTSPLPHMCYMPHPSHSSLFDYLKNIWWGIKIINLQFYSFLHSPVTLSLLGQNNLVRTLFSYTCCLHSYIKASFTPIQYKIQNYSYVYLNLFVFG
jgi:hypothetical protein